MDLIASVLLLLSASRCSRCRGALKTNLMSGYYYCMSARRRSLSTLSTRLAAGKLMYRRCSMTIMFALCLSDSAYALGCLQPRVVVICSELVWLNETCIALLRGVLLLQLQGRQATQLSRTLRVKKCWYEAVDDRLAPLRDKRQPRGKIMRR